MEDNDTDARLKNELAPGRRTRQAEDRGVTESRETSDADRLEMFRMKRFNNALPDLPNIPNYHVCWLTTTNPQDTIQQRMQLGYKPIRPHEVPGFEYATQKTGDFGDVIAVNEMLAFKLPMSLFQLYMKENHHDAPMREEISLASKNDSMRDEAERAGAEVIEEEGMAELRQASRVRTPTFT